MNINGFYYTIGNKKIGNDTLIFNMGSATDCPSKKLGLCRHCDKCYALKAERQYPQVRPFRDRQADYWLNGKDKILNLMLALKICSIKCSNVFASTI